MKINSFGLCLTLQMDYKIYEKLVEGLIWRLQSESQFKDLQATQNCLSLMKRIGNGYGRASAMTYFSSARLLYNMEVLMARLMSGTCRGIYIELAKLKNLLYKAAGKTYHEKSAKVAIGMGKISVGVGSRYFTHLLHMDFTEEEIEKMKQNIANPNFCGLGAMASVNELQAIADELRKYQPRAISETLRKAGSFNKLICSLIYEVSGSYENAELRKSSNKLIKARNAVSHKGKIILDGDKIEAVLKEAFTYLAIAANHKMRPKSRFLKVVKYCVTNPINGISFCLPTLTATYIILILVWFFVPMPKPQRMIYSPLEISGETEELFEAFAKQDTTTVLDIYEKTNIIIETTEAIK